MGCVRAVRAIHISPPHQMEGGVPKRHKSIQNRRISERYMDNVDSSIKSSFFIGSVLSAWSLTRRAGGKGLLEEGRKFEMAAVE